jgi:hypothetical protein
MSKQSIILLILAAALLVAGAQVYKWVDGEGNVHYSDQPPPEGLESEKLELPGDTTADRTVIPGAQPSERLPETGQETSAAVESLPISELGPLPENVSSEYFETIATSIMYSVKQYSAQFVITLRALPGLPRGAYVEAYFQNPRDQLKPVVIGQVRQGASPKVTLRSPPLFGLKCWNYVVKIDVYRGRSKTALLGTHEQIIQSRIDLDSIKGKSDYMAAITALTKGHARCP